MDPGDQFLGQKALKSRIAGIFGMPVFRGDKGHVDESLAPEPSTIPDRAEDGTKTDIAEVVFSIKASSMLARDPDRN